MGGGEVTFSDSMFGFTREKFFFLSISNVISFSCHQKRYTKYTRGKKSTVKNINNIRRIRIISLPLNSWARAIFTMIIK